MARLTGSATVRVGFVFGAVIVAIAVVVTGTNATSDPAKAKSTVAAPFIWQGVTWCPTYRGNDGCDNLQRGGSNSAATFNPSQVVTIGSSRYVLLKMNSTASETGAINTQEHEIWNAPATLSEQINLPCNSAGQIENWPAFWLVTTGSWPAGGEIDVVEGLRGSAAWHYHYLNSSGARSAVGGRVSGFSGCGTHTYVVSWTTSAITFYYDGKMVGRVTPAEIGVPIASGPMYVIDDYATSSIYGGPITGNVNMELLKFTSNSMPR
jgi:beta-glucanase (GH16 family)